MQSNVTQRKSDRHQAAVLFADISGFTALSERLDPEAVTDLVNRCFQRFEAIVHAHGGSVDKYIGDCIVAVFGLGEKGTDATRRAARAALDLCEALRDLESQMPYPLGVHAAVESGMVVAGEVGGDFSRSFTVLGPAVSMASRLLDVSMVGEVVVGPHAYAETEGEFEFRPGPVLDVASESPIPVYRLLGGKHALRHVERTSERRRASVMFAEIVGLRRLGETLSPERFTQILNRCFALLENAVRRHGGVVDKYVSETLMALFGVPNAIEDAAKQAINAAIEMRSGLQELAELQGLVDVRLRVGVNTGLVIAGEVGGRLKRNFTVLGDIVNLASRLKDAAPAGEIYVGADTHHSTCDDFDFVSLAALAAKGKARPVPVYAVVSAKSHLYRGGAQTVASGSRPSMVGRDAEMRRLTSMVDSLSDRRGGIAFVIGEAGIGKSRLTGELCNLPQVKRFSIFEGRSLSIGQGLSFHPFVDLLRRWLSISDDDAPREAAGKLARRLRELLPEECEEYLPFIARLMGLRLTQGDDSSEDAVSGEAVEEMIFHSMRAILRRLADLKPLVLLLEDFHWADQSSVKLLESLLRLAASNPILFVIVARPEFDETTGRVLASAGEHHSARFEEIRIGRLTDEQADALILNLLPIEGLPYPTRAVIIRKAEGNPYYIEEVVRSLRDLGAVIERGGGLFLTEKINSVVIPDTIHEVVMSRVDRLEESARYVLQVASVIGRRFYHRVLAEVTDHDDDLERQVQILQERELIVERRSHQTASARRSILHPERELRFRHALGQETVYESLLQRTRKDLHRRVARAIESVYVDRLHDFFGELAYHYTRAEDPEKAEEYLFQAGEEAARSAASAEALHFFREASELYVSMHGRGGDPIKKSLLEQNLGLALLNTGALTESIDHFDAALEHLGTWVPRSRVTTTMWFAFNLLSLLGQLYAGLGRRRAIQDWQLEQKICDILLNRGRAEITSDPRRLFYDTVAAFRRFNEIDATRIENASAMYASAAAVFCYSGISFKVSRKAIASAKQLARPGNVREEFVVRSMDFIHQYLEGDWSDDHVIDSEFVETALREGLLWDVNTYVGLYADRLLRQGRFAEARSQINLLGQIADEYGYGFAAVNRDAMNMLLLVEERSLDAARAAAEEYQGARHEDPLKVLGLGTLAKVLSLTGELEGAAANLALAEQITARSREIPPWHLSAYAAARLRCQIRSSEEGSRRRAALRRSMKFALSIAHRAAIQRVEIFQLVGCACWEMGRKRRALAWWNRSLTVAEHLSAAPEASRTQVAAAQRLRRGGQAGWKVNGSDIASNLESARMTLRGLGLVRESESIVSDQQSAAA